MADRGGKFTGRADCGSPVVATPRTRRISRVRSVDLPIRNCRFGKLLAGRPYDCVQRGLGRPAPPTVLYSGRVSAAPAFGAGAGPSGGSIRFERDRALIKSGCSEPDAGACSAFGRCSSGSIGTCAGCHLGTKRRSGNRANGEWPRPPGVCSRQNALRNRRVDQSSSFFEER